MNKFYKRGRAFVNFDKHCLNCENFKVSNVLGEACCNVWEAEGYAKSTFWNTSKDKECIYPDKFEKSKYKKVMSKVVYVKHWETGEIYLLGETYKICDTCRRPIKDTPYKSETHYGWGIYYCSEICYKEIKKRTTLKALKNVESLTKKELRELVIKFHPDKNKDLYEKYPEYLIDYKNMMNEYNIKQGSR